MHSALIVSIFKQRYQKDNERNEITDKKKHRNINFQYHYKNTKTYYDYTTSPPSLNIKSQ